MIYPYVDPADIGGSADTPNIWYQVDGSGSAILDADGNLQPVYCTNKAL